VIARDLLAGFARTLGREGEAEPLTATDREVIDAVVVDYLREQGIDPDAEFDPSADIDLVTRHRLALAALSEEWERRHRVVCGVVVNPASNECERKMRGELCLHPWPLDEGRP
jgi:hypothetical protein